MARGSIKKENDSRYLGDQSLSFVTNKKGELLEASDLFCKKVGCVRDDILGLALEDAGILTEESCKKVMYRNVSRLVGKEKPFYSLEIKTPEGNIVFLEIETKPFIKNGKIVGEIAFVKKSADATKPKGKNLADKEATLSKKVNEKNDESTHFKSELVDKSTELDLHKQDVHRMNEKYRLNRLELEEKDHEIKQLQAELKSREQIIDEIQGQLTEKQTLLVEKTDAFEKLQIDV